MYVIGVWLGNPDGSPSGCLKGAKVALPLAQSVVTLLGPEPEPPPPLFVQRFRACPITGRVAGADCPSSVEAWQLTEKPLPPTCRHYQLLWSDKTHSYCERCLPEHADRALLRVWKLPTVSAFYLHLGGALDSLPPHNPCFPALDLEVLHPQEGATLWLSVSGGAIALEAVASPLSPILWGGRARYAGLAAGGRSALV